MNQLAHITLMAAYNSWMNKKVYETAGRLSSADLMRDRKAFFGSIFGTLSHLVVADTIWLKRFSQHPARHAELDPIRALPLPTALDHQPFADFSGLLAHRLWLDDLIERWVASLDEQDFTAVLHYSNTQGKAFQRDFFALLMHFFNHQTHHRGQATTLLSQAGENVGVTDLLALIADAQGSQAIA